MTARPLGILRGPLPTYLVGLLLAGDLVLWFLQRAPSTSCDSHAGLAPPLNLILASVCGLSFILGGLLTEPIKPRLAAPAGEDAERRAKAPPPPAWIQAVLLAFLLLMVAALAYETFSFWEFYRAGSDRFWPITWFVRCDTHLYPTASLIVAAAISGLVGHWLWFRPRQG